MAGRILFATEAGFPMVSMKLTAWLWIPVALFTAATPLDAQIPGLPVKPVEAPAAETTEATEARLQLWVKEAKAAFARVNEADAESKLPAGVDPNELLDCRRDLEQIIIGANQHQKVLESGPGVRKALEAARAANLAWKGFPESPPYSMLMVDDLVNQREAIKEKDAIYRSSRDLFSRTLTGVLEELRSADERTRELVSNVAEESAGDSAAKWRLEAHKVKSRLLALRATFLQSNIALQQDQSDTASAQLDLLNRQISVARKRAALSDADMEKVKRSAADRQAAVRKEVEAIRKRLREAIALRQKQQAAVDQLLGALPEGKENEPTPELTLARVRLESAETRGNSLEIIAQMLDSLEQLESYVPDVYQNRKAAFDAKSKARLEVPLQNLRSAYDRLQAWETVLLNDLAGINANIGEQEARARLISADDPRLIPISDIRASLWEKQVVVQRVANAVTAQRKLLRRWLDEFDDPNAKKSFAEHAADLKSAVWNSIKGVWRFQVFEYKETTMTLGGPVTLSHGVSLGKFFIAIASFAAAYGIALAIKNRLRNTLVRRGHVAEAQAKTLSNWMMLVVGFLLALATLHFLSIPLTVFAFFGGALAIGLGFGSQTLIKNFICGIIVLVERRIRVGDIVDLGGVIGTITEINTRSSVLRGGDGKETLVPNSLLLENRVTNLTLSNRRVRRLVTVRVPQKAPVQMVHTILEECAERHGLILKEPAPIVTLEDFVENANIFGIYYWTEFNDKTNSNVVASDLRFMAEKRIAELMISVAVAKEEELKSTPLEP